MEDGSNLGQRPRRGTKMQTHAHIYFNFLCLFGCPYPYVCLLCTFHQRKSLLLNMPANAELWNEERFPIYTNLSHYGLLKWDRNPVKIERKNKGHAWEIRQSWQQWYNKIHVILMRLDSSIAISLSSHLISPSYIIPKHQQCNLLCHPETKLGAVAFTVQSSGDQLCGL